MKRLLYCVLLTVFVAAPILARTPTFSKKANKTTVKQYEIFELTFKHDTRPYDNAYQAVDIKVDFRIRGGDGTVYTVHGFYYGEYQYKVRFMLPMEGKWAYDGLFTVLHEKNAGEKKFNGTFTCRGKAKAPNHGPLRVHKENPVWLVCEDGSPVYLNGLWTHSSMDATQWAAKGGAKWGDVSGPNFNKFAEHAISQGLIKTDGEPTEKYFKEIDRRIKELVDANINFMVLTADHMAWGYQTASNWKGLKHGEFNDPFQYNPQSGKVWDYALKKFLENGIYIKLNFQEWCQDNYDHNPMRHIKGVKFGDENPDSALFAPEPRKSWELWIKYLVSRYGAYSNVHWEVGNEPPGNGYKSGQPKWLDFVTFLRDITYKYDPHKKMFDEGGPVGASTTGVTDNRVFHDIEIKPSGTAYYKRDDKRGKPYHYEEVRDFPHAPLDDYLASAKYNKMACFVGGGYGTSLVMLSWVQNGVLPKYLDVCKRVGNFFNAFKNDYYQMKPDSDFIIEAPGEFCKGLAGESVWAVYLQRDDVHIKKDLHKLPAKLVLNLPEGSNYVATWFDIEKGTFANRVTLKGGTVSLTPPPFYKDDTALRIVKK